MRNLVKTSKFLSLVLRHRPERIGLSLDKAGWADIDELIECARISGVSLSKSLIRDVVRKNDKQRFKISQDELRIRANQGHSLDVDLGLTPVPPPEILFHGTVERFFQSIMEKGLKKGRRQYVHLSPDAGTALGVGARRGRPIILEILAGVMHADGHSFRLSENGVWLTDHVPPKYIRRTAP